MSIGASELYTLFPCRKMNHKQEMVCAFWSPSYMKIASQSAFLFVNHFTEDKHHHDPDGDSGLGPSTFTDTKSTTFSEVSYCLTSIYVVLCDEC